MRLVCPNCGAQYAIAEDVIPPAGRDVQCSNCGHTWFQTPDGLMEAEPSVQPPAPVPSEAPSEALVEDHFEEEVDLPESEDVHTPAPQGDAHEDRFMEATEETHHVDEPTFSPESEPEVVPEPEPAPEPEPEPEAPAPEPSQRGLDSSVADILREEAEFEQAARAAEHAPLETQTDMDLPPEPATDQRGSRYDGLGNQPRERAAAITAAAAVSTAAAVDTETRRSTLLPDIDEINSSLRPGADQSQAAGIDEMPRRKSGFRRGFIWIVALFLIAVLIYIFAPQISAALPQIEPALTAYVGWVDGLRLWLDAKVQGIIEQPGAASDAAAQVPVETPAAPETAEAPTDITTDAPALPEAPEPEAAPQAAPAEEN